MNPKAFNKMDPARWNECINLLCQPLESLDAIQRPAALVFHYDGHVCNGGHSYHFDFELSAFDDELIHALRNMGAHEQARILAEARLLQREASEADGCEQESLWEIIADLDQQYYKARPSINEILSRYFTEHEPHFR